jgi:hypothetical protein
LLFLPAVILLFLKEEPRKLKDLILISLFPRARSGGADGESAKTDLG